MLSTPELQHLPILLFSEFKLCKIGCWIIARQPFSGLAIDLNQNYIYYMSTPYVLVTSHTSDSYGGLGAVQRKKATPVYIWPCVLGYCPAER